MKENVSKLQLNTTLTVYNKINFENGFKNYFKLIENQSIVSSNREMFFFQSLI